jgi:hypothetical protein
MATTNNNNIKEQQAHILAKRQTHIPILVLATEAAHKIAWKNQLRLTDLLEGLSSSATTTATPFRSAHRSMAVDSVRVTFVEPDQIAACMADDAARELLHERAAVQTADGNLQHELALLEDQVDNLLASQQEELHSNDNNNITNIPLDCLDAGAERQRQLEQATKDAFALTSPLTIPWLWRYRQALDESTNGAPHELFQCPPLCLLVCTTQEVANPVDTLRSLQSKHYLPPAFQNGLMDPDAIRQEVLVLHDNNSVTNVDWKEAHLRASLQQQFGVGASLVRVNSIAPEAAAVLAQEETSDLWGGGGARGNCLSVSDRVVLRTFLSTLVTNALLPAMEKRIADLNAFVSDRKKGVKNVLKSFWRGGTIKSKEDDEATPTALGDAKYRFDSVESQTRLLGDTLFLMRDYEAALGVYRLIKDDFKQDKAHTHYGGIQEMIALCLYLTDPYGRSREIFSYVENALLSYTHAAEEERSAVWGSEKLAGRSTAASRSTRLGTRLCLVLTSTSNICDERHLEVADLLASASSNETSLGAAVLLEQSSSHYFKAGTYIV